MTTQVSNVCYDTIVNSSEPVVGNFRSLWSWLCGNFTVSDTHSTIPVVHDKKTNLCWNASVPYWKLGDGPDDTYVGESIFNEVFSTLPRPRDEDDYKADCLKVLKLDSNSVFSVTFPDDIDYPDLHVVVVDYSRSTLTFTLKS